MLIMWEIGRRLREQREKAKLTQGQVAVYEGCDVNYISKLERGVNRPNVWPMLAHLAKRYGTTSDYLLGLNDDPSPVAEQIFAGLDPATVAALQQLIDELRQLTPAQCMRVLAATKTIKDLYEPNIVGGTGNDERDQPAEPSE